MKGEIWILWLTIVIGTCYCSYFHNVTSYLVECKNKNALVISHSPSSGPLAKINRGLPYARPPDKKNGGNANLVYPNAFDPSRYFIPEIRELVGVDRFRLKHMYKEGIFGAGVNSFDQLNGNPEKIRRYLVDLNRRMFKGEILPETISSTRNFRTWMHEARKNPKKISLVDDNLDKIRNEISSQETFKTYLAKVKAGMKPLTNNLFTTKSHYWITEITLEADNQNNLGVKLKRFKARIEIGMRRERVYHYHSSKGPIINDNSVSTVSFVDAEMEGPPLQTQFTERQLMANAKTTVEFWERLFNVESIENVRHNWALNDKANKYKRVLKEYEVEWEKIVSPQKDGGLQREILKNTPGTCARGGAGRKKRAEGSCAFYVDTEGGVESIHPKEFMEVFELAPEEGRGKMLGLLKRNGDKYVINDDKNWLAAKRHLNQLIHHNEMTIHAEMVETTGTTQDWRRWKISVPKKPSQLVTAMSEAVSTRMNKIKLSATKVAHSIAESPHTIAMGAKPYGYLMTAKGLINGIIHDDDTAVAVVGSRLGWDMVTEIGTEVGAKFFNRATKVGRATRVLGELAGPIGGVVDIGLGVWSLTKSVTRLKEANNKYDRDDAIADIVSESVDVAVGAAALYLSVIIPIFSAPVVVAAGLIIGVVNQMATAIFKTVNEVKRINSEIPLSRAEKFHVFETRFMDIFGLREKDYLDYLVEEKHANDLEVSNYLQFLKKHDQFMGVLFPSRSLWMDGGCELIHYTCFWGSYLGRPTCKKAEWRSGCSWNAPCYGDGRVCVNEITYSSIYDCNCDENKATANFGVPHTDSEVDFRRKRKVFWERSVPGDVAEAEFKCKPSYLQYTDHQTQQPDSRNEYHCYHAIGLQLPEREQKKGQSFLINLEDGKDTVITDQNSDNTPYTYWLGEKGEKSFWGGRSRNEFILNGNCSEGLLSGNIYGGPEATDSLVIGPSCAKGNVVQLINPKKDINKGDKINIYLKDKLNLHMERVENIIGRPNDAEHVEVECNTRKLILYGGASSNNQDVIKVYPLVCPLDLVTMLGNFTDFSSRALNGEITVYVGEDMEGSSINVVRPKDFRYKNPKTTIIFTKITSEQIDIQQATLTSRESSLKLWDSSNHARAALTIKYNQHSDIKLEQHQIFFHESTSNGMKMFSVLIIPANDRSANRSGPLYFFHDLQEIQGSIQNPVTRVGNQNLPNLFNISGDNWNLNGGQKDDTFILNTIDITRVIINGKGGDDTLVVQRFQNSPINLNGNDKLKSVERVIKGDKIGSSLEVNTGCDTNAVVTKSEDERFPDVVKIHKCTGPRELQIDAGGFCSVIVDGDLVGDYEIVRVVSHRISSGSWHSSSTPAQLRLDTQNAQVTKLFVQVELGTQTHRIKLRESSINPDGKSFRAVMENGGFMLMDLNLKINDNDGIYLSTPQIQLLPKHTQYVNAHPSQLVFHRDTLEPVAVHVLQDDSPCCLIRGFEGLQNLFQIQAYSNETSWTIEGGGIKDTFVGGPIALAKSTLELSFGNGDNTLVVNYDEKNYFGNSKPFHVNLQEEKMGWKGVASWYDGKINGGYMHHVIGRPNQPDIITTGCDFKSVAGRGGVDSDHSDVILIQQDNNCENQENELEVILGKYTKVENFMENGTFKYFVDLDEPLTLNPFKITATSNNLHKIVFQDDGQQSKFTFINFDKHQQKLGFHVVGSDSVLEYPMYRPDDQSHYINPKFLVNSKENWVIRDVRVDNQGSVVSTTLLDSGCANTMYRSIIGLPLDVNNFLVNITSQGDIICETVIVASGAENSRSNHFWLYGLSDYDKLTIQGTDAPDSFSQISSVHLGENFQGNKSITVDLSPQDGYIGIPGQPEVKLMFITNYVGRGNGVSYDIVMPSCYTKQISGVDLVNIRIDPGKDCEYSLTIGMEPGTQVDFEWIGNIETGRKNLSEFWNSTFYYRFTEQMSFELGQSYPGLLDGTKHYLYLPFNLDEMETLSFEKEENKLYYTIDSEKYSVTMVSEPGYEDQFYPQPAMVTQDGLRILVERDCSLLISGQLTEPTLSGKELLDKYQGLANTLGVTMMLQTNAGLLHVGHDSANSIKNVLSNVAYSDSYLGGGGTPSTIYEVVSLDKDVYIATGLNDEIFATSSVNKEGPYITMQTLDLTDIVSPIRYQTRKKYKPTVNHVGDHLVISMEGHLDKYPGQIIIYGGVSQTIHQNLQILLSHSMMKITPTDVDGNSWQLVPMPVLLERETVYSLAAEDLEYDHHITVLDHLYGPEYHFRFNYSKKGNDLHLSDIEEFRDHCYDERHIEMTTVIITDFYKKSSAEKIHSNGTGNATTDNIRRDAPAEIVNVTLDLPGLKIKLDGTDVFLLSNENPTDDPVSLSPASADELVSNGSTNFTPIMITRKFSASFTPTSVQAPVLLDTKSMSEWGHVLHQLEEEILEDLPFVHRIY